MLNILKVWVPRLLILAVLAYAGNRWGVPLYHQYFTPKKKVVFVPTTKARQGSFVVSFHEMGALYAEKSVDVTVQMNGKLLSIVNDGSVVLQGQKIAVLDTTDLERDVRNQKLNYENTKRDVDRAKAELEILKASNQTEVEQSQAELDFNKAELERAKKLVERKTRLAADKLVPRTEIEDAELQVRTKELAVLKGEKGLALKMKDVESKETQKNADVRNVEFRASMAKLTLDDAEDFVKRAVITAPAAGLAVLRTTSSPDGQRTLQAGDMVNRRQSILSLPDLNKMLVKVKVGEGDVPRVVPNMPVRIKVEAIPNKVYGGTVKEISTLATEGSPWEAGSTPGKKTFEVTVQVTESDPAILRPGMTTDCEFVSKSLATAVFVPIEAVTERQGKTWAFLKKGGAFKKVQVKTGIQNDNFVTISRGVKPGEMVALRDPFAKSSVTGDSKSATNGGGAAGSSAEKAKKPAPMPEPSGK